MVLKKNQQMTKKHEKLPSIQRVKLNMYFQNLLTPLQDSTARFISLNSSAFYVNKLCLMEKMCKLLIDQCMTIPIKFMGESFQD